MPVLTDKNKADLKSRFDKELVGPVTLRHFTQRISQLVLPGAAGAAQSAQGSQVLRQTREILEEMAATAPDKIKVEVYDLVADRPKLAEYQVARIPCTLLDSAGRARYYGIPAGYEFTTIVQAIVDASQGHTPLREPTLKALAQLDQDINLKVFVTPT
ncbi:MAG: thioredoxin family protein [Chloroflexi bacterium]|nr:thioredoxin family protein [Chloroflexota bacterium]